MPNQYYNYLTLEGDTFDAISLDFYNAEKFASTIIQANPEYRQVLKFKAGITLKIPVIEEEKADSLPPWKRV